MTRINKLRANLNKLKTFAKHERMIELTALLTEYFKRSDINPIIVGGLSVEIYTRQNYSTYDIDLVSSGWDQFDELLTKELGFEKSGRGWYHEELEISIEIPSNSLDGNLDKVVRVELPSGRHINVIGIEDIIIHRLESASISFPKTPEWSDDYMWAKNMFLTHKDDENIMDIDYLLDEASKIKIGHIIKGWLKEDY